MSDIREVIIIGSGPAGFTAAIYTARAGLKPLVFEGAVSAGGALMNTSEVENFPGFTDGILGPELMLNMRGQAERFGAEIITDDITAVDLTGAIKTVTDSEGKTYQAKAVILATGSGYRRLGLADEDRLSGRGVSWCATCDGFFFRGKRVAVVGGGNSAVEEALYLANIVDKVTVVHRRDSFRAERILQDRLFKHPKVEVVWNHVVDEILGGPGPNDGVTGLRLRSTTDGSTRSIDLDGVFIAIGHSPATALFRGKLDMDAEGYLVTRPDSTATNIPGIFAAGDVKDKVFRQAVTAAGMCCMAALEVEKFLMSQEG